MELRTSTFTAALCLLLATSAGWLPAAGLAGEAPSATAGSASTCEWSPEKFNLAGVSREVRTALTWDDGNGEALYAAGLFTVAGAIKATNIARWDGGSWSPLAGPFGEGVRGPLGSLNVLSAEAMAIFDDGSGPALYVAGEFTKAGGIHVNRIAKWDGSEWFALTGSGGTGVEGGGEIVYSLEVFDDGNGEALYVGGNFETAGGLTANGVARWDGSEWSVLAGAMDTGVQGGGESVNALRVFDDGSGEVLYVGGSFASVDGFTANGIARWDGSAWSIILTPTGIGIGLVNAMTVFDDGSGDGLFVGGGFFQAGGINARSIAKWDGTEWSVLAGPAHVGMGAPVSALAVFDDGGGDALYASGFFLVAGGVPSNRVAKWDGDNWSALSGPGGTGVSVNDPWSDVRGLAVFDDGGGPALFVGGEFQAAGGVRAFNVARWSGSEWSSLGSPTATTSAVLALETWDDGNGAALYAGGSFDFAGNVEVSSIARWDGYGWSPLAGPSGPGVPGQVRALAVFDDGTGPALYAGGSFLAAGGVVANHVARWDGTAWSALTGAGGTGVAIGGVHALAVFDDGSGAALYVAGDFRYAGGIATGMIARWDGSEWSVPAGAGGVGIPFSHFGGVRALATWDDGSGDALYAGGAFQTAGDATVNNIARWDGDAWTLLFGPFDIGVEGAVYALAVFDGGSGPALHAAGALTEAGGVEVANIAKWDATGWSPLAEPFDTAGLNHSVTALATYDDGTGPALYAAGSFLLAGDGVTVDRVARWDGSDWSALAGSAGPGLDRSASALEVFRDGADALYVGGSFTLAGGRPSLHLAEWNCFDLFRDGFENGDASAWSTMMP